MSNVATVTETDFDREVLEGHELVVVDFWAEWCPPCKMLSPVLDKVAASFGEQVKVVKCNIDDSPNLAQKYGVMSIPNLLFFKDGQIVNQSVGYVNEAHLSEKVKTVLGT